VAEAKKVAKKSSSMDERMSGWPNTHFNPSRPARRLSVLRSLATRCGRRRMSRSEASRQTNEATSKT